MTDLQPPRPEEDGLKELHRLDHAYDLDDKKIGELLSQEDKQGALLYIQESLATLKIKQDQANLIANWIEAELYYFIHRFKLYEGQTYTADDGTVKPYRSFSKWASDQGDLVRLTTLRVAYRFRRRFGIEPDTSPERWEKLMNISSFQKIETLEVIATRHNVDDLLTVASGIGADEAALTYPEIRQLRAVLEQANQKGEPLTIQQAVEKVKDLLQIKLYEGWSNWETLKGDARKLLRDPDAYVTVTLQRQAGGKSVVITIKED